MICSRCGTNNAKTSKFCRECGNGLAELLDLETAPVGAIRTPDDQAVSDLLYEALKLYEHDSLEEAFQKCRQALGINPAGTSARSLLALVYEKKCDVLTASGDMDDAHDYLTAAIRQIELILEANPDSEADRDKLNSLRARMIRRPAEKKPPNIAEILAPALIWLRKLPPITVSIATVLIVFVFIFLLFRPHSQAARTNQPGSGTFSQQTSAPKFATSQPQTYPATGAGAYGYPRQNAAPQAQADTTYPQQQAPPRAAQPSVIPVPSAPPPTVTPVNPLPGAAPPDVPSSAKPSAKKPAPAQRATPAPTAKTASLDEARQAYGRGDYAAAASILQEAISAGSDSAENNQMLGLCYYNMNRGADAVSRFERAIQLYTDRKSMGENADAADQGIRTCKQFILLARE